MPKCWLLAAALSMTTGYGLQAQEMSDLGINLSINSSPLVGVTVRAGSIQLRPSLSFGYNKTSTTSPIITSSGTTTRFGLNLDLLFPMANNQTVVPYLGAGAGYGLIRVSGSFSFPGNGHTVTTQGFLGVRVRVVERVHVYGELGLGYTSEQQTNQHFDSFGLRTTPLGVLIYLK